MLVTMAEPLTLASTSAGAVTSVTPPPGTPMASCPPPYAVGIPAAATFAYSSSFPGD
jgi:hypothetical protein